MVLIHGWAGSAESWGPVAARLSESTDFEPVCVRLPGSPGGGSGDEASIAAAAARVVTHLRARGQASVLVGHSMGGQISLLVHAAVPELVVGEVVIDPAYGADPSGAEAMEEWARQIERRGHDALGPFFEGALGSLDERTRAAIMGDLGNTSVATIVSCSAALSSSGAEVPNTSSKAASNATSPRWSLAMSMIESRSRVLTHEP